MSSASFVRFASFQHQIVPAQSGISHTSIEVQPVPVELLVVWVVFVGIAELAVVEVWQYVADS